jgi:hypothetical protein
MLNDREFDKVQKDINYLSRILQAASGQPTPETLETQKTITRMLCQELAILNVELQNVTLTTGLFATPYKPEDKPKNDSPFT